MADIRIKDLTSAAALLDTDVLAIDHASRGTKNISGLMIRAYVNQGWTLNTRTGSYTLVLADGDGYTTVEMNVASANNLTVPPNSTVAFPIGTSIPFRQIGGGQTTVVAGSGVTVNARGGAFKLAGQWAEGLLTKRATDVWVLSGDLSV